MNGPRIGLTLRQRELMSDATFDCCYDPKWQAASRRYWTPVGVALHAADWLTAEGPRRILDVGSGVGKLCIVGALATGASFTGVEQRRSLVDAARSAAERLAVAERTTFLHGTIDEIDLLAYDAFYFYNPFGENLYAPDEWLDDDVEIGKERFRRDVGVVSRALVAMPIGARVVTYHGLGGSLPDCFSLERTLVAGSDVLRLWTKRRAHYAGFYVELSGEHFRGEPSLAGSLR